MIKNQFTGGNVPIDAVTVNKTPASKVKSPCIGVCSTGIGDSVCRGCKRFTHEIIHWNAYSERERSAIRNRLESLLSQVVSSKLLVVNESLLREQVAAQKIRHNPFAPAHCLAFDLLKAGANQITSLKDYGIAALPGVDASDLPALRDTIDQDFFVLSSVHYERYFPKEISE